MKKIVIIVLVVLLSACSSDSSDRGNITDGQGGSLARFTLSGNYLYTVGEESLSVFDVSNTENPVFKGNTYIGFNIETLFGLGDKLFVGSQLGMYI